MPASEIIKSLATGLDALALLAEAGDGLRVKDVAAKLGVKPPVAHNLLRTLKARGFVERDASAPVYRLGSRLEELVASQRGQALMQWVEAVMGRLAKVLPEATITFTQPVNGEVAVRRRLSPDNYGGIERPVGFALSLYGSASGLAILAFGTADCLLALQQRHPVLEEGARFWARPEELDAYLERVRRQGYAVHPHGDDQRLALACPVWDGDRRFAGVMGVARTAAPGQTIAETAVNATVDQLKQAISRAD